MTALDPAIPPLLRLILSLSKGGPECAGNLLRQALDETTIVKSGGLFSAGVGPFISM
jgi:hypothetical protein